MTAAEAFQSVTGGGANDFADVVQILALHPPWCLIDGLAVNCFVDPVYTLDADLVVVSETLPAIEAALAVAGFVTRQFPHSLNVHRGNSQLQIQFSTDPRYAEFVHSTEEREVLGVKVRVATLENLIRGKVWAWRDPARRASKRKKDELDLLRIAEAYPNLRSQIPPEIVAQL